MIDSFIINKIIKYYESKNFSIQKKKRNIFILDGFIKYPIKKEEKFKCVCSQYIKGICSHILYYIVKEYNIHEEIAYLMPILDKNDISDITNNKFSFTNFLDKMECPICLESVLKSQKQNSNIYQCSHCFNLSHQYCTKRWNKNCSICRNDL